MPGPATKPGLGRRPLKDRPAPQPPEAKDGKDKRTGRKKAEDGYKKASDRAYKAFNQVRTVQQKVLILSSNCGLGGL